MAAKAVPAEKTEEKTENVAHPGAHPGGWELHTLERNFKPANKPSLDERRWLKNEFWTSRGPTTAVRIDELSNLSDKSYEGSGDTTDRELAADIINRAGLMDHPRRLELTERFAHALSGVKNPRKWLYGYNDDNQQ